MYCIKMDEYCFFLVVFFLSWQMWRPEIFSEGYLLACAVFQMSPFTQEPFWSNLEESIVRHRHTHTQNILTILGPTPAEMSQWQTVCAITHVATIESHVRMLALGPSFVWGNLLNTYPWLGSARPCALHYHDWSSPPFAVALGWRLQLSNSQCTHRNQSIWLSNGQFICKGYHTISADFILWFLLCYKVSNRFTTHRQAILRKEPVFWYCVSSNRIISGQPAADHKACMSYWQEEREE